MPSPLTPHQAAPALAGLLFLGFALTTVVATLWVLVRVARRRPLGRLPSVTAGVVATWVLTVAGVGLAEHGDRLLGATDEKCFDDWCVALEGLSPSGPGHWQAAFRLHNLARARAMSGSNPRAALLGENGTTAWASAQAELRVRLEPGASRTVVLELELPSPERPRAVWVAEGPWFSRLMPGDETSVFHGRWLFALPVR
jgi:hypothetical protein